MAITVKHKFVSAIPDAGDTTIVQPSNWNDSHDLTGTVPIANGGTNATTAADALTNLGAYPASNPAGYGVGTVTSVTGTSPVSVATGTTTPVVSLAASYGDTQNPYASKTANYVLAAPNGSAGVPTFRALVSADIPTLGTYIPYTGASSAIDLNAQTVTNIAHLGINSTAVPEILFRAYGDNNSSSRIAIRGYSSNASSSSMRVAKFRGTFAAPQAPLSGDSLGKFELAGYGTTSSSGYPQASYEGVATENWGATARGAKALFYVTPNTTTTQAVALTIDQDKSATFAGALSVTGHTTFEGVTSTGATGTGKLVYDTSPTLVTPLLGTPTSGNFSTGTFTWPTFNQNTTGSAAKWTTARTESLTGDITGSTTVDGSANYSIATTLATVNSNVGTYTKITINGKGLATAGSQASLTDLSSPTASFSFGSQLLTNLLDPVSAQDAATKLYVDNVAQGLDAKASVVAATTANITLSGAQTIDGIAIVAGDRVLVKNQTLSQNNGIYVANASTWTRSTDMDTWAEVPGAYVWVETGTTQADTGWVCTSNAGGTLGTTPITWVQFAGASTYTAGTGLTLTGTQFAIDSTVATLTGSQVLTNKTISGASNTLSNIGNTSLTNSAITINGTSTSLGGSISVGTVTGVSVTSANGFAGTSSGGATPALTLSTSITGILKGNATAISAATSGTDYAPGTSANTSGLVYSTTTTGALTTATGSQVSTALGTTAISGNAANVTGIVLGANGGTGVANTGSTITLGGNLTYSGAYTQTWTRTANTSLTLPTSGTVISTVTNMAANPVTGTPSSSNFLRGDGTWASPVVGSGTYNRTNFTATAGQTSFTVAYTVNFVEVFVNGVLLDTTDYTATSGTAIVLATAAALNDIVTVIAYNTTTATTAAGSTTQVQYNSGGNFAGSANLTFDGTTLTAGGLSGPHNGTVGATTANTGAFSTISATGAITSTLATGTAPFTVASTTQVANLNAATAGTATSATTATNIAGGALGSLPYQNAAGTTLFLAGNTTTTPQFLTSTGAASAATAPTLTSSTGSGSVVLATSPTLVTPALGTPASGVVTNLTGTASININGTVGATTPAAGTFTQITVNGSNLNTAISPTGTGTVTISPAGALTINPTAASTINNASIGATTASTGRFTSITATTGTITPATGTASVAPISLTSGTNLTSAVAGAIEYDGSNLYVTTDTTQGRGVVESVQQFYLSAAGSALTGATQNYFNSTSAASLAASSTYDIECYCYFLKTTSGTVQWIPTVSSAFTVGHCALEYTPVTGFTTSVITGAMVLQEATIQTATTLTNTATAALTTAVYHIHKMKIRITTNLACNFRLNATISAGSITPQAGSWYTVRKVVANAGNFVA